MSYLKYILLLVIIGFIIACNSNQTVVKKVKEVEKTPKEKVMITTPALNYSTHNVPWSEISSLGKIDFDYLVPYGEAELQIGELRTPLTTLDTFPLVIFIHGGCWLSDYNLDHVSAVCADLVEAGYAVWTPEYRRVGDEGGGYPNTFKDIQASVDFARTLADIYPLDLENVVIMGHSAGGHLALWLATQQNLTKNNPLYNPNPLSLKGVISLAGITDLVAYDEVGNDCSSAVAQLMDGTSEEMGSRYHKSSPINLLPAKIPIRLIHGDQDNIVPLSQSEVFAKKAKAKGENVTILTIEGGGHFDMVSPHSAAWLVIKKELAALVD